MHVLIDHSIRVVTNDDGISILELSDNVVRSSTNSCCKCCINRRNRNLSSWTSWISAIPEVEVDQNTARKIKDKNSNIWTVMRSLANKRSKAVKWNYSRHTHNTIKTYDSV